jgi:hypothetical protein
MCCHLWVLQKLYKLTCINFRFQVIDNCCTVLDKLSARAWGNYSFCGGTDYVNFKNGYGSLVRHMVQELPAGTLWLNSPVVTVKWQQSVSSQTESCADLDTACEKLSAVDVTGGTVRGHRECQARRNGVDTVNVMGTVCGDAERHACHNGVDAVCVTGTAHGHTERQAHRNGVDTEMLGSAGKRAVLVSCSTGATYAAGHVIVTCSLGCLKACSSTMFEPALPHHMVQVSGSSERETYGNGDSSVYCRSSE